MVNTELLNLKISDFLLIIATILSIISGIQYYNLIKKDSTEIENLQVGENKN